MFAFHLKLALASIRRTPWTTLVAVLTIGLGVGAATSMTGIYHIFSGDPLPQKSDVIFNVRIDTWDANSQFFGVDEGDPPKSVTYQDMTGLMKSDIPLHQTGVADGRLYVFPDDGMATARSATCCWCWRSKTAASRRRTCPTGGAGRCRRTCSAGRSKWASAPWRCWRRR